MNFRKSKSANLNQMVEKVVLCNTENPRITVWPLCYCKLVKVFLKGHKNVLLLHNVFDCNDIEDHCLMSRVFFLLDRIKELKKLNHSIFINFLELLDILIKSPSSTKVCIQTTNKLNRDWTKLISSFTVGHNLYDLPGIVYVFSTHHSTYLVALHAWRGIEFVTFM